MSSVSSLHATPVSHFLAQFARAGASECSVSGKDRWTYAQLLQQIDRDADCLADRGVQPGDVVALTGASQTRQLSLFFALARLRTVIVPLHAAEKRVSRCSDIANVSHLVRLQDDGSWGLVSNRRRPSNELLCRFLECGEPGLIVFTSGSTGEKKAILHNLTKLLRKYLLPRKNLRTLNFLTLDHLGGLNTALYTLSNTGLLVFPETHAVSEVCQLIQDHRIQLLPTTPSFLTLMLLSDAHHHYDLSSLELLTYGTESMPAYTLKRLRDAFPSATLQQTYGLSEVGALRSKSKDSDSLWVRVGGEGVQTKVVDGTLWIRTESAMEGYLNAPEPFADDGWLDTGDMVEVEGDFLKFLGRKSTLINVGGQKVYPAELENFLLSVEGIVDAAVCHEPHPLVGNIVVAHIVRSPDEDESEDCAHTRIRAACAKALPRYMVPSKVYFVRTLEYSEQYKKLRGVKPS